MIYNQQNRLIRVEENSAVLGEYTYNALGQRVTKTVNAVTTVFHYDFDGNLIGESAADGTFQKEYIYVMGNRFAMVDSATRYMYFYHNDHLGTPVLMTDVYGSLVWEGNYTPFGDVQISPQAEIENNFRFAGQYYDQETGLHYNYHRYYDPTTGRYLTPDPIGLAGGINLYAYVQNNPVNGVDPFGLLGLGYGWGFGATLFGKRATGHIEARVYYDHSKPFWSRDSWSASLGFTSTFVDSNDCDQSAEGFNVEAGGDFLFSNAKHYRDMEGWSEVDEGFSVGLYEGVDVEIVHMLDESGSRTGIWELSVTDLFNPLSFNFGAERHKGGIGLTEHFIIVN